MGFCVGNKQHAWAMDGPLLSSLPLDVLLKITKHLDGADLAALRLACRALHTACCEARDSLRVQLSMLPLQDRKQPVDLSRVAPHARSVELVSMKGRTCAPGVCVPPSASTITIRTSSSGLSVRVILPAGSPRNDIRLVSVEVIGRYTASVPFPAAQDDLRLLTPCDAIVARHATEIEFHHCRRDSIVKTLRGWRRVAKVRVAAGAKWEPGPPARGCAPRTVDTLEVATGYHDPHAVLPTLCPLFPNVSRLVLAASTPGILRLAMKDVPEHVRDIEVHDRHLVLLFERGELRHRPRVVLRPGGKGDRVDVVDLSACLEQARRKGVRGVNVCAGVTRRQ